MVPSTKRYSSVPIGRRVKRGMHLAKPGTSRIGDRTRTLRGWALAGIAASALVVARLASSVFTPRLDADSELYLWLAKQVFTREAWWGPYPIGYPFFLRFVQSFDSDLTSLPAIQLGLYVAGIAMLARGLHAYGVRPMQCLVASVTLLWVPQPEEFALIMTDLPALSCLLGTLGFLLLAIMHGRLRHWLGVAALTGIACSLRPAYLFLMITVPLVGLAVAGLRMRRLDARSLAPTAARLAAAAWIPPLLLCAIRWLVIGHFALSVSGGLNLSGIVGQFLDEKMVAELSPQNRPLAERILEMQRRPSGERPPFLPTEVSWPYSTAPEAHWQSPVFGKYGIDRALLARQYMRYLFDVVVAAGGMQSLHEAPEFNRRLRLLCMEILARDFLRYARWWVGSMGDALVRIFAQYLPLLTLLLALALVAHLRDKTGGAGAGTPWFSAQSRRELALLSWLAAGVLFPVLSLVVTVCPPFHRYVFPATALIPVFLTCLIYCLARRGFRPRRT